MSQLAAHLVLAASTLAQVVAAGFALAQVARVRGRNRLAWGAVALALVLMVERRAVPLWRQMMEDERAQPADAAFGLAISVLMAIGVWGLRWLFEDLHRHESQLDALARTDALTGLPNRREILDRFQQEHARSQRAGHALSLIVIDLDHFKRVNDTHGHAAGDAVLRAFAEVAGESLRRMDVCGRTGGEEFLVLLPETGLDDARAVAERLREALATRVVQHGGHALRVTASLGVASHPARSAPTPAEELLRRADDALYAAKAAGRDRVAVG